MKKLRLNHQKLNEILLDPFKEADKRTYSDFQIYYIQEAAKAFMDIHCNDFVNREGIQSRLRVNEKAVEILTEFDLFLDADPFYDLYQKSLSIKELDHPNFDNAKKLAKEALQDLDSILSEPADRKSIELKKAKERINLLCRELNIPIDEALNFIKK